MSGCFEELWYAFLTKTLQRDAMHRFQQQNEPQKRSRVIIVRREQVKPAQTEHKTQEI
uniref:Uncharacterized protein n=1 Tax=Candidatus Methanogaster sp. ANME-2c ERB4 TaxID=2759911 RepID=A0A7G9YKB2_9EURY|nr:hypothetical protein BMBEPEAL_00010 [Methanosarcinales archaeon ANME-2c ERB4]